MNFRVKNVSFAWFVIPIVAGMMCFGFWKKQNNLDNQINFSTKIEPVKMPVIEPLSEAVNNEGSLMLEGFRKSVVGGATSYSFSIIDSVTNKRTLLYETVGDQGSSLSIPRNSWSPDSKQVYLEVDSPGGKNYYLFKVSGESYKDGKKFIAIQDYWDSVNSTARIFNVTGWVGSDQLAVYTSKSDGQSGQAYWFITSTRKYVPVRDF